MSTMSGGNRKRLLTIAFLHTVGIIHLLKVAYNPRVGHLDPKANDA